MIPGILIGILIGIALGVALHPTRLRYRRPAPEPTAPALDVAAIEERFARSAQRETYHARQQLIGQILPVIDNLERALAAVGEHAPDPALLQGVSLIHRQLGDVLRVYGVHRIDALRQRFDPRLHEAIGVIPVQEPELVNMVVHQTEPGYVSDDHLIRPAKVIVGQLGAGRLVPEGSC